MRTSCDFGFDPGRSGPTPAEPASAAVQMSWGILQVRGALAHGAVRSSDLDFHAWGDYEAIGDGSVAGFGSLSPVECSSPLQFWSALPELWPHGLRGTVRAALPWWCSHSCWSAWSPWMRSAGESSFLFAVSWWTVGQASFLNSRPGEESTLLGRVVGSPIRSSATRVTRPCPRCKRSASSHSRRRLPGSSPQRATRRATFAPRKGARAGGCRRRRR
jgi:hypothetical protein